MKKKLARLKINVYAGNLEPVPNRLNTKFFILRGFVCLFIFTGWGGRANNSLGRNIVLADVYGSLAVLHPQRALTSGQCGPLCLRPAVSPQAE